MHRPKNDKLNVTAADTSLDALEAEVARRGSESVATLVWLAKLLRESLRAPSDADETLVALPRVIGRFRLEALLGSGAYGVVFRAFDLQLARYVALKLAWPRVLVDPTGSQRFADEPRAMAAVPHPGIVEVYDSGEIDMVGFIAMELIEGQTLAEWRKCQSYISERTAAKIIRDVAEAIGCAHAKGIVHRDLKPSNVLLRSEGKADECFPFEPVVTDFGLARRARDADASQLTATCAVVGTDHYMSPEQAAGANRDVCPASDVFSLGVMLYELLAGRRPFDGESAEQVRRQILASQYTPLRLLRSRVARDLITIVAKCLEADRQRRYYAAGELADDLSRYLEHRPIRARRLAVWQRGLRFAKRRPAFVAAGALALASLLAIAGLAGAWVNDRRSSVREVELARAAAAVSEANERQQKYVANIQHAALAMRHNGRREVEELLTACRGLAVAPVRCGIEWELLASQIKDVDRTLAAHQGHVHVVRFSADGNLLLSAGEDGRVVLWETVHWTKQSEWNPGVGEVNAADLSADASLVATGGVNGRVVVQRVADRSVIFNQKLVDGRVFAIAWLGEALEIAVGGECPVVSIVDPIAGDVRTSTPLVSLPVDTTQPATPALEVADLTYLKEQNALAIASPPQTYHLLDAGDLRVIRSWRESSGEEAIASGPDGTGVVATSTRFDRNPWSGDQGRITSVLDGSEVGRVVMPHKVKRLRFSRDGSVLAGAYRNGAIWTWNSAEIRAGYKSIGRSVLAHTSRAVTVDMSPDNRCLASGGWDGRINLWRDRQWGESFDVALRERPTITQFSPCGRWFAVVNPPSATRQAWQYAMFDARSGELLWKQENNQPVLIYNLLAFSPSGDEVLFCGAEGALCEHDPRSGEVRATYHVPTEISYADVRYSPDGKYLHLWRGTAKGTTQHAEKSKVQYETVYVDRSSGEIAHRPSAPTERSAGSFRTILGTVFVRIANGRNLLLSKTPSSAPLVTLTGPPENLGVFTVSTDGRYVAAAAEPGIVYSWDIEHPASSRKYIGHEAGVFQLLFSPDHRTILSVSLDGTARLWCTDTGAELLQIGTPDEWVYAAALHPSGNLLVLTVSHADRFGLKVHRMGPDREALPRSFDIGGL